MSSAPDDIGGDPVCWLQYACPECGAMPSEESDGRCWRCGEPLTPSAGDADRS